MNEISRIHRDLLVKLALKKGWSIEKFIEWVTEGYPQSVKPKTHCERSGKKCED